MTQEIINSSLTMITQVLVCTLFTFAINYLRHKIGKEKFDKYFKVAYSIVTGVEQKYGGLQYGEAKKTLAHMAMCEKLGSKLSPAEIDRLIETAVFEMNSVCKKEGLLSHVTSEPMTEPKVYNPKEPDAKVPEAVTHETTEQTTLTLSQEEVETIVSAVVSTLQGTISKTTYH